MKQKTQAPSAIRRFGRWIVGAVGLIVIGFVGSVIWHAYDQPDIRVEYSVAITEEGTREVEGRLRVVSVLIDALRDCIVKRLEGIPVTAQDSVAATHDGTLQVRLVIRNAGHAQATGVRIPLVLVDVPEGTVNVISTPNIAAEHIDKGEEPPHDRVVLFNIASVAPGGRAVVRYTLNFDQETYTAFRSHKFEIRFLPITTNEVAAGTIKPIATTVRNSMLLESELTTGVRAVSLVAAFSPKPLSHIQFVVTGEEGKEPPASGICVLEKWRD